jgi:hypothetical protein
VSELSPDEIAVVAAIREHPGTATRTLARTLKRRPASIIPLVHALTEKRQIERRPLAIRLSDGRSKTIEGLYAVDRLIADHGVCPSCGVRRRHFEGGAECQTMRELRELGRQLDWQRVPFGYGKVIQAGELMWTEFLDRADHPSLIAGIRHAREWVALNSQIRKDYATA